MLVSEWDPEADTRVVEHGQHANGEPLSSGVFMPAEEDATLTVPCRPLLEQEGLCRVWPLARRRERDRSE